MSYQSIVDAVVEDRGGRFTLSGRSAAINAALPLLASYFADAATWNLEVSRQLAVDEEAPQGDVLDDFAAGARLRGSLAAAERLLTIVDALAAQPTFRYTQVSAESVGTIRGRLDIARYSRLQGRIDVPRRYPIRVVERESATPENILAAYACQWIRRDLAATPRRIIPPKSPEARELETLEQALRRMLGRPVLAGAAQRAIGVWRRGQAEQLIDQVSRRLDAGHVARAEPYLELLHWILQSRSGSPVAAAGDREWSFYDEQFDTKLFEIWCLLKLSEKVSALIGPTVGVPRSLAARKSGPIYTWNVGGGTLKLHFQPSLKALSDGAGAQWHYEGGADLRGFPDIAVTAESIGGKGLALFDPKLRRRPGAPTEEIYKLLGYFANLKLAAAPQGAILYYSPGVYTDYKLIREGGGEVRAIGLDPESNADQFASVADIVVRLAGLGPEAVRLLRVEVGDTEEERLEHAVSVRASIAVEGMRRAVERLPPTTLAPTRKQTAATLRSIWGLISDETKTMIVTAEYFANSAPDDADHSGPLLGLAASVERVLRDNVIDPAAAASPGAISPGQTLGSCLRTLENALRGRLDSDALAVADYLRTQPQMDLTRLGRILPAAKAMNRDFRIPAAHAELVASVTWALGRDAILNTATGVLPRLVEALGLAQE